MAIRTLLETDWAVVIGLLAFIFIPISSHHVSHVKWFQHVPERVKMLQMWWIWLVANLLMFTTLLAILLNLSEFDKRVEAVIALLLSAVFIVKFWHPMMYWLDKDRHAGPMEKSANDKEVYFTSNTRLWILFYMGVLVFAVELAALITLGVIFKKKEMDILAIVTLSVHILFVIAWSVYTYYTVKDVGTSKR
jgi:hypothetical protein